MEQLQAAEYWMWMKRKHVMKTTRIQASSMVVKKPYDSWEEEAFAEDAAGGPLGGCIWPPRSYSCSFCRREFRSAQALGGHMNVHRRDRARLKQQSLSPQNNEVDHHHDHHQILHHDDDHKINSNNPAYKKSSCTTHQCPSDQLGSTTALDYNHYSKYCSPSTLLIASSTSSSLSTSRVVSASSTTLENFKSEQLTLLSPYSKKSSSPYLCTPPPFGSKSEKYTKENEEMSLGMGRHGDCVVVDTDLSVGLNYLVVERGGDDQVISCKRHKTFGNTPPFPFFLKPCCLNPSSSMEELDLELRLGDPPKVK